MTQKCSRRRAASLSSDDESLTALNNITLDGATETTSNSVIDTSFSQAPNNISRREARLAKKDARKSPPPAATPAPTAKTADNATIAPALKPEATPSETLHTPLIPQPTPSTALAMPPRPVPLLIASLGNPEKAYGLTLHSAGHNILNHLRTLHPVKLTDWAKSRAYANAQVSQTAPRKIHSFVFSGLNAVQEDWTFWKSPSLMNVSGKALHTTIRAWRADPDYPTRAEEGIVVIVHDELERPFGQIGVRVGGSHKGHNGLKSCNEHLGGVKNKIVKIGVGIGRPVSREPAEVSRWVMRQMTQSEQVGMLDAAKKVMLALREIEVENIPKAK